MRITESELRRIARSIISEGSEPSSTKPWPDCTIRGTGPLPPAINAALIRVCTSAAAHVEQNYPPRPTGFGVSSDVQAAWSDETIAAMKGDPIIDRAITTVLVLYRSMIPAEERSLINFDDTSTYLGTFARYDVCKFLAHPWTPFNEFPDTQVCVLVGTLTLLCKRFLEREGYTR
jgi:hypothetical protein